MIAADELIAKLRSALQREGDFPVSAKVVSELRQLTSDPKTTAEQVTELILREPSLGTRVLHFVNSAFMRRAKPILTVSQAVIQIGMKPLADLCAGLVLLQKFVPASRRSGPFAQCLKRTVLVSLLSSSLKPALSEGDNKKRSKIDEGGYLMGQFSELGVLLLGFYFPEILEAAAKRSEQKNQDLAQSIRDLTGLSSWRLSLEVIEALQLPAFYREVLEASDNVAQGNLQNIKPEVLAATKVLSCASDLGACLAEGRSKIELDAKLKNLQQNFGLDLNVSRTLLAELPRVFKDHCGNVELELPPLPEFMSSYSEQGSDSAPATQGATEFTAFVQEIRQMVDAREPTASIITSVMETIAYGLKFDRVLLMLVAPNKQKLLGRMLLGNVQGFDPKKFERIIADVHNCPALKAYKEGRPVFKGDPIFDDGWPIAALPVGLGNRAIGVIYADRVQDSASSTGDLSQKEQASLTILGELLERSITSQARNAQA